MNKIIIKGRICREIDLRQTDSGKTVGNFSTAVNKRMDKDSADFFDCTAWEKTAEFISNYFTKGQEILIEGRMESRKYTDKDGNNRIAWSITVEQVEFCGSKNQTGNTYSAPTKPISAAASIGNLSDFEEIPSSGDVPF